MTSNESPPVSSPYVFISYSNDSPEHRDQVLAFATLLRTRFAVDAHLDRWYEDTRRDWPQWAVDQLGKAAFVLAIASPSFRERADGRTGPDDGRGARFEGAIMRSKLTRDHADWTRRILPVVLPGFSVDDIPDFLMPYSASHFIVPELTPAGIADLVRTLTGQPRHPMPELGSSPVPPPADTGTSTSRPNAAPTVQRTNKIKNSKIGTIVMGDSYHIGEANG